MCRTVPSPTAKQVVLDLLSTLPRGEMPVRALVAAGAVLGVPENGIRVGLARLRAAGLVERDARGAYRLGARAATVCRQVVSWRRLDQRVRPWDGGWIAVHLAGLPRADRGRLGRRMRALRLLGLRELVPGLEVRPDNLVGGVAAVRAELYALGLDGTAPIAVLRELDAASEARARRLWPVATLEAGHRRARRTLEHSERRLAALPEARAMAESFLLGGRVIRQLVLDPLLPEAIMPGRERERLLAAMRRYDRLGRACWARFMQGFGLPHVAAPLDLRLDPAAPLAAAGGMP